jgi:hypothetical protein
MLPLLFAIRDSSLQLQRSRPSLLLEPCSASASPPPVPLSRSGAWPSPTSLDLPGFPPRGCSSTGGNECEGEPGSLLQQRGAPVPLRNKVRLSGRPREALNWTGLPSATEGRAALQPKDCNKRYGAIMRRRPARRAAAY